MRAVSYHSLTSRRRYYSWASACILTLVCAFSLLPTAGLSQAFAEPAKGADFTTGVERAFATGEPVSAIKRSHVREPVLGAGESADDWPPIYIEHNNAVPCSGGSLIFAQNASASSRPPIGQLLHAPRAPPSGNLNR